MSGKVEGESYIPISRPEPGQEKPLDVFAVAIRNPETGEWESPSIDQAAQKSIQSAIAIIQKIGNREQAGVLQKKLSEEGAELEITQKGIYVREGEAWKDILDDASVKGETRMEIRKSLNTIAEAVKTISTRTLAPQDVATTASQLPAGEVVIQVHVRSTAWRTMTRAIQKKFIEARTKEQEFNREIGRAIASFDRPDFVKHVKKQVRWTDEEIRVHKERLASLKAESDKMLKMLDQVHEELQSGHVQKGIELFCSVMKESFPSYAQAAAALAIPQKVARGRTLLSVQPEFALHLSTIQHLNGLLLATLEIVEKSKVNAQGQQIKKALSSTNVATMMPATHLVFATVTPLIVEKLNSDHQKQLQTTARLGAFVRAYRDNRELFEKEMRKQGISDLESALLFNHYEQLFTALEERDKGMQRVVDLANQNKSAEAMEAYTELVINDYPKIHAAFRPVLAYDVTRLQTRPIREALHAFNEVVKASADEGQIIADLSTQELAARQKASLEQCLKMSFALKIPVPTGAREAVTLVDTLLEEENTKRTEIDRLIKQDHRYRHFFNSGDVLDPAHPLNKAWMDILKNSGWDVDKIVQFTVLMNKYADQVKKLREAQLAIESETNPLKKRALQAQLVELARQQLPVMNALNAEFKAAGGILKFASIRDLVEEFAIRAGDRLPAGMREEAQALVLLMRDRAAFLNDLYTELGILKTTSKNTISNSLLHGPHVKDPDFDMWLSTQGWTQQQVKKLSEWYDAYFNAAAPLKRAKEALDADPENVTLQNEFKKVAAEKLPLLKKLQKEWDTSFGEERWEDLLVAVRTYEGDISDRLASVNKSLVSLDKALVPAAQMQKADFEQTLRQLKSFRQLADRPRELMELVSEASRAYDLPQSWDKEFLAFLSPIATSPLMSLRIRGQPQWPQIFKQFGLTLQDITQILKLMHSFQTQLKKMAELERQLEAEPENIKLRQQLKVEMLDRRRSLGTLNKQLGELSDKISNLDKALQMLRGILREEGLTETQPQAAELDRFLGEMSIAKAFHTKQSFVDEIYGRFPITSVRQRDKSGS